VTVAKPVPGRRYNAQQMEAMRQAYPDLIIPGHVMRIDADGMFTIVPEVQGAGAFGRGRALQTAYRSKETIREIFPVEPIKRRTPQQRLDSLHASWAPEATAGGFPGLSEEQVRELVGRAWKRGEPVSSDDVRALAASMLEQAETKREASERKKVVRTSPTD